MLVHDLGLSRRACDRCHGQKLRCRRENNSDGCLRCQRAGVQCTPRPLRSRQHARSHSTRQAQGNDTNNTEPLMTSIAAQTNKGVAEPFNLSSTSLLDVNSDFNMSLDFSTLQSDIGLPLESRGLQSGMDFDNLQGRHFNPAITQDPSTHRDVARSSQNNQAGLVGTTQGLYSLSSTTSTMVPCYSDTSSPYSRPSLSLSRITPPRGVDCQPQESLNTSNRTLEQREAVVHGTDSEKTGSGTDPDYIPTTSSRPQSTGSDVRSVHSVGHNAAGSITPWIRKLSNINVELHQHMLSMPLVELQSRTRTNGRARTTSNSFGSTQQNQELAIDRTLQLSKEYNDILGDLSSHFKAINTGARPAPVTPGLDQSSQLLVLSSYLCLIELYDKIVQHLKMWTEARIEMGDSTSNIHFPIQLPSLVIGSFKLPTASSAQSLVLTCIIEATIKRVHDLVSELMDSANTHYEAMIDTGMGIGDKRSSSENGLCGVAKVTLQAIRAKEDSTMKLIHNVWKLALKCGPS